MKALIDADSTWIGSQGYAMHGLDSYLHRTIASRALGRKLKSKEVVHHLDYNKLNNDSSNLIICDQKYHMMIHARTDCINAGFSPETHSYCWECKIYHTKESFPKHYKSWNGLFSICKEKSNERRRGKYNKWTEKRKIQQQCRRLAERLSKEVSHAKSVD